MGVVSVNGVFFTFLFPKIHELHCQMPLNFFPQNEKGVAIAE